MSRCSCSWIIMLPVQRIERCTSLKWSMWNKHHLFVQHIIQLRTFCDTCSVVVYINSFGIFSFLFFYPKHILDLAFLSKLKPYDLVLLARKSTILVTTSTSAVVFQRSFLSTSQTVIYIQRKHHSWLCFLNCSFRKKKKNENIASNIPFFPSAHPRPPIFFFSYQKFPFSFPLMSLCCPGDVLPDSPLKKVKP